jgi:hypothetical protein
MPSREEGVDSGCCFSWVELRLLFFESKSIGWTVLSTTVLVVDAIVAA